MLKLLRLAFLGAALLVTGLASAQVSPTGIGKAITSTANPATVNSGDIYAPGHVGGVFVVNVSAFTSGTLTCAVQGRDPISGNYYPVITSAALAAVATTVLRVYPGLTAAANLTVSDVVPPVFRVSCTGASAVLTFSVSYLLN